MDRAEAAGVRVEEMADRVAALMGRRLGLGGRGLEAKLRRAGRDLPRHVRAEAEWLAQAARVQCDPRLRGRADPLRAAAAYGRCTAWLRGIDPRSRSLHRWLDWAAGLAFQLLLLGIGLLAFLRWRGFL